MSQVEDVTGPSAGPRQHIVGSFEQTRRRSEQQTGIQIALDGAIETDRPPGFIERLAPIDANDVATGRGEIGENRGVPTPK